MNTTQAIFASPRHPYIASQIACIPAHDQPEGKLPGNPGTVPGVLNEPPVCRFHTRCADAMEVCRAEVPVLQAMTPGNVACQSQGVLARFRSCRFRS